MSANGHIIAFYDNLFRLLVYDHQAQSEIEIRPEVVDNGRSFYTQSPSYWPAGALYLSADSRYLAFTVSLTTAQECTTVIYDINRKRVVFKLPAFGPPGCQDFTFTRDGRYLLYREYYGQDQSGNEIRDITALAWQTGETRRIEDIRTSPGRAGTLPAVQSFLGHQLACRSNGRYAN